MNKSIIKASIAKNLERLLSDSKISVRSFSKGLKVSESTVYNWLKMQSLPSIHNITKICNLLDIKVDALIY